MARIGDDFYREPWYKQVGWIWDQNMDCLFSVSPDHVYERITGCAFRDLQSQGIFKAPDWFEDIYPDWRDQILLH